jgi:hypothetical protein
MDRYRNGRLPYNIGKTLSGAWFEDPSKTILYSEYFGITAPILGRLKYWDGSAWVSKSLKVWNGTTWDVKPLKRWNGTAWVSA